MLIFCDLSEVLVTAAAEAGASAGLGCSAGDDDVDACRAVAPLHTACLYHSNQYISSIKHTTITTTTNKKTLSDWEKHMMSNLYAAAPVLSTSNYPALSVTAMIA